MGSRVFRPHRFLMGASDASRLARALGGRIKEWGAVETMFQPHPIRVGLHCRENLLSATSIQQVGMEPVCAPLAQLFFLDLERANYFFVGGLGEIRIALGAGGLFLFLEVRLRH